MEQKTDAQKTILIVEDEKNIVDILRFNLQREGYRTCQVRRVSRHTFAYRNTAPWRPMTEPTAWKRPGRKTPT